MAGDVLRLSQAVRPSRLPSESTYRALLARQARGEVVDVKHLTRPGIVAWSDGSRTPWGVIQGARRYEKLPPSGNFDGFIDVRAPLPKGAIVLESEVPASLVYAANVLSSRGSAGANPELVAFITKDKRFKRVLFPAATLTASTSEVLHDVRKLETALQARLGADGLTRVLHRGYGTLSPIDRLDALRRVS
jgi:hypothetical protein